MTTSRRSFLVGAGTGSAALTLGFNLSGCSTPDDPMRPDPGIDGEVNAWLVVSPDNTVLLRIPKMEMGQGVLTSLAMVLAEELGCRWEDVRTEFADATRNARGRVYGSMLTDGSSSIRGSMRRLQRAGANARTRLVLAAARRWGVSEGGCHVDAGHVTGPNGLVAAFGELAADASTIDVDPAEIQLKNPASFELIGRPVQRSDVPAKVDGTETYGIDVIASGQRYAAVRHCPVPGGQLKSVDGAVPNDSSDERPEILETPDAVFAVAESYWAAQRTLSSLDLEWETATSSRVSTADLREQRRSALRAPGTLALSTGSQTAPEAAELRATYEVPYLAHACLEPLNCTASLTADSLELWIGTQNPQEALSYARELTGLSASQITVHAQTMGGAFGRRIDVAIVGEAIALAKRYPGVPVKLIWSREENFTKGRFRPMAAVALFATMNGERVSSLLVRAACDSILSRFRPDALDNGVDPTSVMGLVDLPYDVPNLQVETQAVQSHVEPWFWRSVGDSQNAYAVESFLDEIAIANELDPISLRLSMLNNKPRHEAVLNALARHTIQETGAGRGSGIAIHENSNTIVGMAVDVSVSQTGEVTIERIVAVADCGLVVNPTTAAEQIEGAVVFGLSAALYEEIDLQDGEVADTNFDTYRLLRMNECPNIEVEFIESGIEFLGGLGEPGVPPVAPALCNAIYRAAGKRIRSLPVSRHDLSWA